MNKQVFRAVLFLMAIGALLSPIADFFDRSALKNGEPAIVVRASKFITAPEQCFSDGDCQLTVKVTPDHAAPFTYMMVFNQSRIDQLLNDGSLRVHYVADRPARHIVDGDALPSMSWGMLILSIILFVTFGISIRLK